MHTQLVLNKLHEKIRTNIEILHKEYHNSNIPQTQTRYKVLGYTAALRDAGLITDTDKRVLYIYCTV